MDLESVISTAVSDSQDVPMGDAGDTGGDTGDAGDVGDTGSDNAVAVAGADKVDPLADETDAFAKENGYRSKRPDGRENRIPHSRVQKISESQVRKALAPIAKELGLTKAEAELKIDDIMAGLGERNTKFKGYEERLSNVDAIEQIMQQDPDRFISMMAEANPTYKKFLERQAAAAEQKPVVDAKDDPRPEPDYPIKDAQGNVTGMTYSLKGLDALNDWRDRQAERKFQAKMDERFKPLDEQQKREQTRLKAEKIQKEAGEKIDKQLARASKWHGWKDNEAEILKAFQGGAEDIFEAWMQTVIPKITADRTTMRAEILKELKGAPKDTSAAGASTVTEEPKAGTSIEDIIRQSVRSAGHKL